MEAFNKETENHVTSDEKRAAELVKGAAQPEDESKCNKCGSDDLQVRKDEIITFRDGKLYAVVRALPMHSFKICNACRNVMVKKDDVEFRLLNRAERRRLAANNRKKGSKK